jgi:hypothetical protein
MEKTLFEKKKVLVDFMGLKPQQFGNNYSWSHSPFYFTNSVNYDKVMNGIIAYVPYNTEWNWLMPVVGRISKDCEEPEELDGLKYALLCNDIDTAFEFVVDYLENSRLCNQEES